MTAFCYGRPSAINIRETDVQLPSRDDFPMTFADSDIFIEKTKLCVLLGRLADARSSPASIQHDGPSVGEALKSWAQDLREELQLYNGADRRAYRRVVSELHIIHLVCMIIYLQSMAKSEPNSNWSSTSLDECVQASSQITRLMEEVFYRNEVPYLAPINNWFCLLAGVIQIRARATFSSESLIRSEELGILKTVLQEMIPTVPSSDLILKNLERLEHQASRAAPGRAAEISKNNPITEPGTASMLHQESDTQQFAAGSYNITNSNILLPNERDGANINPFPPIDNWALDANFDLDWGTTQFDTSVLEPWAPLLR